MVASRVTIISSNVQSALPHEHESGDARDRNLESRQHESVSSRCNCTPARAISICAAPEGSPAYDSSCGDSGKFRQGSVDTVPVLSCTNISTSRPRVRARRRRVRAARAHVRKRLPRDYGITLQCQRSMFYSHDEACSALYSLASSFTSPGSPLASYTETISSSASSPASPSTLRHHAR